MSPQVYQQFLEQLRKSPSEALSWLRMNKISEDEAFVTACKTKDSSIVRKVAEIEGITAGWQAVVAACETKDSSIMRHVTEKARIPQPEDGDKAFVAACKIKDSSIVRKVAEIEGLKITEKGLLAACELDNLSVIINVHKVFKFSGGQLSDRNKALFNDTLLKLLKRAKAMFERNGYCLHPDTDLKDKLNNLIKDQNFNKACGSDFLFLMNDEYSQIIYYGAPYTEAYMDVHCQDESFLEMAKEAGIFGRQVVTDIYSARIHQIYSIMVQKIKSGELKEWSKTDDYSKLINYLKLKPNNENLNAVYTRRH